MATFPRDPHFDNSLAFLNEGYRFIMNRCERYQTDVFETRLLLNKAICVQGADAAQMFYYPDRFTRNGAVPITTVMLLQDFGSVATLSGAEHRHRKQMFQSLIAPESIQALAERTAFHWGASVAQWEAKKSIVLHDEVERVLCAATLEWAGIPARPAEITARTRETAAMIDGAASIGPRNWRAMWLRSTSEAWARDVIDAIRSGLLPVDAGRAAHTVAWHQNLDGKLLDPKVAAVELLNVLRPTVAVARFVTFAAVALAEGKASPALLAENDDYLESFVHEVRRFYPFFPAVAGLVQREFTWRDVPFEKGTWVLLDLYGTNHDRRLWGDPEVFRAERFLLRQPTLFDLIPHGAGERATTHRCPGEPIAIELMKVMVRLLTTFMDYDVPPQDLSISLARVPALPASRMIFSNVRRR